MRNGYETKDGKRIIAYGHVTSTALDRDGCLRIYRAGDDNESGFDGVDVPDATPFLSGFRAFLSDAPELELPVVRSAADVLALMPAAARQCRTEVRVIEGFVQGREDRFDPGPWRVLGTPGEGFDPDVINAVLERLQR